MENIAAHIDLLPTLLEVTDLKTEGPKSELDGISQLGVLTNKAFAPTGRLFFQKYALETLAEPSPFPGGIARQGQWKMVNGNELYNLKEDPGESRNLAAQRPEKGGSI